MVRTFHSALGHRVHATRVCDVLLFALYLVYTVVSVRSVPGLPCISVCLAVGLLYFVSSLLPDSSQRTAFLSCRVPRAPLDWPVAHHSSPGHVGCPGRYSARRFPQWSYSHSHHCPGHGGTVPTSTVLPPAGDCGESHGLDCLSALPLRYRCHSGRAPGVIVSRCDALAVSCG